MSSFKQRAAAFGTFVWNSEEKKFLGRGARSWGEIGLFYLVYYSCLAGFFVGMLAVFYQTIDSDRPKLTGDSSLLKGNPGMGFQPMPDVEYTLVRFRYDNESYMPHVESIKKVLKSYIQEAAQSTTAVDCKGQPAPEGQACRVDVAALTSACNESNHFGFKDRQPCVLLRLNKIFDWKPVEYTDDTVNSTGASKELKDKILADPKMIYIDCIGENPADVDNIGEIQYYPEQGFRHYYYPFINQKNYMSPLVFVKFMNPPKNIALMVECRALAPNIYYDKAEKEGGVHFELLMDP